MSGPHLDRLHPADRAAYHEAVAWLQVDGIDEELAGMTWDLARHGAAEIVRAGRDSPAAHMRALAWLHVWAAGRPGREDDIPAATTRR